MSVHPHPSRKGAWRIKVYKGKKDGKSVFEVIPFNGTKEEALAFERQLSGKISLLDPAFPDLLVDFLLGYKNRTKPRGFEVMERSLAHLRPFFGQLKIRQIQPILIEKYKALRLDQGVKRRTINIELSALSVYFKWLHG